MCSLPLECFPNPVLIEKLHQELTSQDMSGISSHWRQYGPMSRIDIENRKITRMEGFGFGDLHGGSPAFNAATILTYLVILPQRLKIMKWMGYGKRVVSAMALFNARFSYDIFRQCAICAILEKHIDISPGKRILVIGDGYGTLSAMLKMRFPGARLFLVDIMPALFFQAVTLGLCLPDVRHESASAAGDKADMIYCLARNVEELSRNKFDFAINVASMQEMLPEIVGEYFSFLRSRMAPNGLFYCCNRAEKKLTGGEVLKFEDYPWSPEDTNLFDEVPAFYRFFFSKWKTKSNLKVMGIPVPYCRAFDGEFRHRLTALSQLEVSR